MALEEYHSERGWNYKKVNATLNHIRYLMAVQHLSFMETQAILSWLQCDLSYKLGTLSAIDAMKPVIEMPDSQPLSKEMRGYG